MSIPRTPILPAEYKGLKKLGKFKPKQSTEIQSSRIGVGFETLDRDMWDTNQAWPVLNDLGVKWARVQTGWTKTEKEKGVYDFAWLDEVVGKLIERGVTPWLSLSYGNQLYTEGAGDTGVGFPPLDSKEERDAWQQYAAALFEHFKDRVDHYEVWNEPDLTSFWKRGPKAAEYVDLVRMTAEPLRKIQPDAKLIGGAIAWGMTPWSIKFLEDCMRAGLGELIDIVTYHGYKSIPERHSSQEFPAFQHVLKKYNPKLEYWQGESGFQSYVPPKAVGVGALSRMKFSEAIQARMLLRRFLLELHNDTKMCSYFHMADFAHYAAFKQTFHYGIVRLEDGSPKPAYYALQSLATLLADPMEPAQGRSSSHISVMSDAEDPRNTKVATWQANFVCGDIPVLAWWIPESVEVDPEILQMELTYWIEDGLKLDNPVLIDPITQEVFEVSCTFDKRTCAETWMDPDPEAEGVRVFKNLPICNSPLLLTDRSLIELI
ncbi:GH39 family glycosyl hydrolase [Coraliomargarita parva]|uniref:GH39 family glycosyl hydrolase n=1 Tax=Coraliomargarita parva TaxID=3014050 RepID=UPI0022B51C74|nr:beta-galactosidase [Coraliomargarita parva]